MSEPKTKVNDASVINFINGLTHPKRKNDSLVLLKIMGKITGVTPKMWGDSIVGFDTYHYIYASGKEGNWPMIGFSPRKQNLSLYVMPGFINFQPLLNKLGKHKTSKACLYINKLDDIDINVLKELIGQSITYMRNKYPK